MSNYQWPITNATFFDLEYMEVHSRYNNLSEEVVANSYITHKSFSLFTNLM